MNVYMNKSVAVFLFCGFFTFPAARLRGQTSDPGEILRVFSNFHAGLKASDRSTAFEVTRVYLGYKHSISDHFEAEVKLDIGSPEDLSEYSLIRRYAYFKTASLSYHSGKFDAWFGLFDMLAFKEQENLWGYRYIYKSFQDEYKFGPSADIGAGVQYAITDYLKADIVVSNGEGYKNMQSDNSYKTGIGVTLNPMKNVILRVYYDFNHKDITQSTYAFFAGYDPGKFRIGAEYNLQKNFAFLDLHDLQGYSLYGTWRFSDQWEVFGRYDWLNSNISPPEEVPWNLNRDGSAIISGVQFSPVKGVKFSVNYQGWYSYAANGPDKSFLYLDLEFKL